MSRRFIFGPTPPISHFPGSATFPESEFAAPNQSIICKISLSAPENPQSGGVIKKNTLIKTLGGV
jgi:hypothetical protein